MRRWGQSLAQVRADDKNRSTSAADEPGEIKREMRFGAKAEEEDMMKLTECAERTQGDGLPELMIQRTADSIPRMPMDTALLRKKFNGKITQILRKLCP